MRTLLIAAVLALPFAALAQGQPKVPEQKPQTQQQQQEQQQLLERIGADGAAGGTAPVPAEKRKAVNANAGPHLHKTAPSPAKLPRNQPVEPPK